MAIKWKSKTSWRQKLEKPQEARAVEVPPRMQKTWGNGRMLIATPLLVDELVNRIPKGKLVTVAQLMGRLASPSQGQAPEHRSNEIPNFGVSILRYFAIAFSLCVPR
jgi:hypothetical protein